MVDWLQNGSDLGLSQKQLGCGLRLCTWVLGIWYRLSGYARAIGITTSVAAELWALRDRLNLCVSLNLQAVEIGLDAKLVVELISKEGSQPNSNDVIVADCKEELKKIPRVRVLHCYREVNKCADALAHREALLSQDFVVFSCPPVDVSLLISLDALGAMYERVRSNCISA
ncbi:hypothetical protein SO802_034601 [Lithocarpus litseifolius]|uniref:RNase H type-1 domain-containing protein n=1 Tax=Lithocarpus litseifolius TaxID=425828 RepID=A0AAW2BIH0_9ROSI